MVKNFSIILLTGLIFSGIGQAGTGLWDQFKSAKQNGTEPTLPDFSYAGYKYCSEPIPDVSGTVFDVTDYGAIANDGKSDRAAIRKAIKAAENNNGGIVYFPAGRFLVNSQSEFNSNPYDAQFTISKGNIVLRGAGDGAGGTEIFLEHHLLPRPGECLHCAPFMIEWRGSSSQSTLADVNGSFDRETFSINVNSASRLRAGMWVGLELDGRSGPTYYNYLDPYRLPSHEGSYGLYINEKHQIKSISGNTVTFDAPLHIDIHDGHPWKVGSFNPAKNCGVEDIRFTGNWNAAYCGSKGIKFPFVHHRSEFDDGAFSAINMQYMVDSWIRRCTFHDWNRTVSVSRWARSSILGLSETGSQGHYGVQVRHSYGVLYGSSKCEAKHWHAMSILYGSCGTVFWQNSFNGTSVDAHSVNPYATLVDNCEGALIATHNGGAENTMPHHLRWFVSWNFKNTGAATNYYNYWQERGKFVKPIIVGTHGNKLTYQASSLQYEESNGTKVPETSLFVEQLKLRLGSFPSWLNNLDDPTVDETAPTVVSVAAGYDGDAVTVRFSESVGEASALSTGNYSLNNGAAVLGTAFGDDSRSVVLTTSPLSKGSSYTLRISGVKDRSAAANTMAAVTKTFSYDACIPSAQDWTAFDMDERAGAFRMTFDVTPLDATCNGLVTLSQGDVSEWSDCAVLVRFNNAGAVDARDGGDYDADATLMYAAGTVYRFRVDVDVAMRTYDVRVTPAGGSETVLAADYAFRTEQSTVRKLDTWNIIDDTGSISVCNVEFSDAVSGIRTGQLENGNGMRGGNRMFTLDGRAAGTAGAGIYLIRSSDGVRKVLITD